MLSSLLSLAPAALAQKADVELLKKIPWDSGYSYRCDDMVRVVNAFRQLGKEKALDLLGADARECIALGNERAVLVCRLLFSKPDGWEPFIIGEPHPTPNDTALGQFPLFPLALSDGVPFFLLKGYGVLGWWRPRAPECVQLCRGLKMITADLPHTNYQAAARKLVESEAFRRVYKEPRDAKMMAEIVLAQAGVTPKTLEQSPGEEAIGQRKHRQN